MTAPWTFNPTDYVIGISHDLEALKVREQADPPIPVDGMTFGVASMSENAPHAGEMHPDGGEVLNSPILLLEYNVKLYANLARKRDIGNK
jgi:hypothetical protein